MKAVSGNPHPKPERKPDVVYHKGESTLSVYFNHLNVEVFQEQKGHTQRLQLSPPEWEKFQLLIN
jgi:hypothetical protein